MESWLFTPDQFCNYLQQSLGVRSCYFVRTADRTTWLASHPQLQPMADHFAQCSDYDEHESLFMQIGPQSGVLQSACIHRTCRGNAAGGVRFWYYSTVGDLIRDGMRLGVGMTLKNALAGLWHGGGKGVMAKNSGCYQQIDHEREAKALHGNANCSTHGGGNSNDDDGDMELLDMRKLIFEEYGEFISRLHGAYVTAEDVGVTERDMRAVFSRTRFTTCIPVQLGGSGNPSGPTARGVARGLEAALKYLGKSPAEATVAVQGVGHVGSVLVRILLGELNVRRVIGTSMTSSAVIRQLQQDFGEDRFQFRAVDRGDLSALFEGICTLLCI
jgi:leucine dehydrogenase